MNSIVIGSGFGGIAAALRLRAKGHKVTLIEKNSEDLLKPCGGGMAAAVQKWFPFELSPIIDEIITRVDFSWRLADPVVAELPGSSPFWIVKRESLDALIINKAIKKYIPLQLFI